MISLQVPSDLHLHQLMPLAWINRINHPQLVLFRVGLAFEFYLGIKVPAPLQVILQIATAFIEQIIIQRVFFVYWNTPLEDAAADFETLGSNDHRRSQLNVEGVINGIGFWTVGTLGDRYLRQPSVLFLIFLAQSIQRSGHQLGGNKITRMQMGRF